MGSGLFSTELGPVLSHQPCPQGRGGGQSPARSWRFAQGGLGARGGLSSPGTMPVGQGLGPGYGGPAPIASKT